MAPTRRRQGSRRRCQQWLQHVGRDRASRSGVVIDSEWAGLHPHAFRHLVATQLDEAGLSAREIADYLGHDQISLTQDVYMNRKATGSSAAEALGSLEADD